MNTYPTVLTSKTAAFSFKCYWLTLLSILFGVAASAQTSLKINFQDSVSKVSYGWLRDYGQPFGSRTSANQGSDNVYGWKKRSDNTPLDLTAYGRKRTSPSDTLLATLVHMQPNSTTEGIWEAQVANGNYDVTVSVGDGGYTDSKHYINIEGVPAIINFVPTSTTKFNSATVTVTVSDGLLTVDAIGGTNTKINYINIKPSTASANVAPVFSASNYSFSLTDAVTLGTLVGTVTAKDANGDVLKYTIKSGNTNSAFAVNSSNGAITVAKLLNYNTQDSYTLTVRATDAGGLYDVALVNLNIKPGTSISDFPFINWGTVASEPYGTHEVHGVVVNKKLYVFGGYDVLKQPTWTPTKRSYVYDPVKNTWTAIADLPHLPNGTNFGGITHEGLTTDGTDIYFAGGYTSNSDGTGQLFSTNQVWRYNVATNTYTRLPDLPEPLATGQMQYLRGKLHYMGGANKSRLDVAVHYVLNLDSLSVGWKPMAPLTDARNHPGSAVYKSQIYFIGGAHNQDAATVTQKTVEVYNEDKNVWTRVADMPIGLDHISSSVVVIGNRILVLGGETSHNVKSNRVLAYTPSNDSWTDLTKLPASKSAGVGAVIMEQIYYAGGNFSKTTYKGIPNETTQQITSFTLINADTDQPIQTLTSGSTLNLATLPTHNLNIQANTNPATVGSVVFQLSGAQSKTVTESLAPYALFGDDMNGDYYAWTPIVGSYTLKATPYSASKGTGTAGTSLTVSFSVIDQATTSSSQLNNLQINDSVQRENKLQLSAYPNPNLGDKVLIKAHNLNPNENGTLLLIDIMGQVQQVKYSMADADGNINIVLMLNKRLLSGTYFLKLQTATRNAEAKLIIK